MRYDTPLRQRHAEHARDAAPRRPGAEVAARRPGAAVGHGPETWEVEYISYGPPDDAGLVACEVPATFGMVEAEYAAIRRGAGLLDCPHRGTLRVAGADRRDFLDRLLTQTLGDLPAGSAREAFFLSRQGRIQADLLVIELGEELLLDVDVHDADATRRGLEAFVFTEDVTVSDATDALHRIAVHGRLAAEVVAAAADESAEALAPWHAARMPIGGVETVAVRRDQTGETGIELTVPRAGATAVWEALLDANRGGAAAGGERRRVRPIGWYAFNTARIEAGTPLFNVDFGPTNLPHETGVLGARVSFTKGCYPGQEIVARIESRGRPKHSLVGLRVLGEGLPVAEGQVFEIVAGGGMGDQIGVVTSSTVSPMLGARPVAFAMMRSDRAEAGSEVLVNADGRQERAEVTALRFVPPGD